MISIVIPVFQIRPILFRCLEAIEKNTTESHEVLVINAQESFAQNCNRGISVAGGEYIVLLNDDTEVQPGWDTALLKCAAETNAGIVGAKMYFPNGLIQHAGIIYHENMTCGNRLWGRVHKDDPMVNERKEMQAVSFGCVLIHRTVLEKCGPLDEHYIVGGMEDVDYCNTARLDGYKIYYEPTSEVMHYEAATFNQLPHGLVRQIAPKNHAYYRIKWKKYYEDCTIKIDDLEEIEFDKVNTWKV